MRWTTWGHNFPRLAFPEFRYVYCLICLKNVASFFSKNRDGNYCLWCSECRRLYENYLYP